MTQNMILSARNCAGYTDPIYLTIWVNN